MDVYPLLRSYYESQDVLADRGESPISYRAFLAHLAHLVEKLPEKPYVINLCHDRYLFLVGLAGALIRGQITLLPPGRTPRVLEQLDREYHNCYCLTDHDDSMATSLASYRIDEFNGPAKDTMDAPSFRSDQVAAIAFTSGTTGQPRPHPKTWGSLVEVARKTGVSLGLKNSGPITVVATVPPQHMYGLETSIMLPIQHGSAFHAGRPFYPEDIRSVLMAVPGRRLLVTTPIHLRACVAEGTLLPELELILSATAPLSVGLARQCEEVFRTKVMEVYGFAEAGTIAIRRTVAGEIWHVLEGLSIQQKDGGHAVRACYFSDQIPLPDVVLLKNPHEFELRGRCAEFVNVAGHRVALGDLNQKLNEIEGVRDGVFLMPDEVEEQVTRLVAFVVAPGKTVREILVDLRTKVDPVFLPRPLYIVDSLPRNDTGKLLRESLLKLAATNSRQ